MQGLILSPQISIFQCENCCEFKAECSSPQASQVKARERPGASGHEGSSVRCRGPGDRPLLGPPYLQHEFRSQPISSFPCDAGVGGHLRATAPLPGLASHLVPVIVVSSSFLWWCFRKHEEDCRPFRSVEVHSGGCGFDRQRADFFSCLFL